MPVGTQSPELQALIDAAFRDAISIRSRYPHQLLIALADTNVQAILDTRFRAGQILKTVVPLAAQKDTGLIPVCFTFAPSPSVQITGTSILVQLDHKCKVVAIDEDFVPERPNPLVDSPSSQRRLPLSVASSKTKRRSRRVDPAVNNQRRILEADLLDRHGLLADIDLLASESGGGSLVLDTDCPFIISTSEDTIETIIVLDEKGDLLDMFQDVHSDPGEGEVLWMQDDSEETTVNELFERVGHSPI